MASRAADKINIVRWEAGIRPGVSDVPVNVG
jgi:hypothetical protein